MGKFKAEHTAIKRTKREPFTLLSGFSPLLLSQCSPANQWQALHSLHLLSNKYSIPKIFPPSNSALTSKLAPEKRKCDRG